MRDPKTGRFISQAEYELRYGAESTQPFTLDFRLAEPDLDDLTPPDAPVVVPGPRKPLETPLFAKWPWQRCKVKPCKLAKGHNGLHAIPQAWGAHTW